MSKRTKWPELGHEPLNPNAHAATLTQHIAALRSAAAPTHGNTAGKPVPFSVLDDMMRSVETFIAKAMHQPSVKQLDDRMARLEAQVTAMHTDIKRAPQGTTPSGAAPSRLRSWANVAASHVPAHALPPSIRSSASSAAAPIGSAAQRELIIKLNDAQLARAYHLDAGEDPSASSSRASTRPSSAWTTASSPASASTARASLSPGCWSSWSA